MAKGGARPGSGRPKGSASKRSAEIVAGALSSGVTPLEFMLNVLREPTPKKGKDEDDVAYAARLAKHRADQFWAAEKAAPFLHPRLQAAVNPLDPTKPPVQRVEVRFV